MKKMRWRKQYLSFFHPVVGYKQLKKKKKTLYFKYLYVTG